MRLLLIAPDIGMEDVARTALEIQRLGYECFPLTGLVTEEQVAQQCDPGRGYEAVCWLTHGSNGGIMLGPERSLDLRTLAGYMQALNGSLRLVLLASCDGLNAAAQVHLATHATVIFSDGPMLSSRALGCCVTVLRGLLQSGLNTALALAETNGLRALKAAPAGAEETIVTAMLDQLGQVLMTQMTRLDERMDRLEQSFEARLACVESDLGDLTLLAPTQRPWAWLMGFLLFCASVALLVSDLRAQVGLNGQTATALVILFVPASALLFLHGMGFVWARG